MREARHRADLLAGGVVDPDLGSDVALRVDVDPPDIAELPEQAAELTDVVETLVRDRDEEPAGRERREQLCEGRRGGPLGVVGAAPLTAVDPLHRHPVGVGGIPADERFPDVVVGEERVLVVRRVDIDEVDVELRREHVRVEPRHRPGRARHRLGKAQRELVERARRPRLEVGHELALKRKA